MRRVALIVLVIALPAMVAAKAGKEPQKILFCLPGFPGTTQQAQPYVDKVLRHVEQELSWDVETLSGTYLPDGEEGVEALRKIRPFLALVGPSIYASQHDALKMSVIGQVEVQGRGEESYSVITRKDGPKTIEELKGKKILGAVVHDAKFVHNVLWDKKIPVGSATLEATQRPLQALRKVARGQADAAVVDSMVSSGLTDLPMAKDLKIIHTSKPVPAPALVLMGNKTLALKLQRVFAGLCTDSEHGRELCRNFAISSVRRASKKDYRDLLRRYER